MWAKGWRDSAWAQLEKPWDVIVIGGGITGAGILREAARAGLRTLLLEGQDFAAGTSSRSSKLVHGGLRYLRNGQIGTTAVSVRERERLLREGQGLVTPLVFLFANYADDPQPPWLFGLGLALYDLLGLRWKHEHHDASNLEHLAPSLSRSGLQGGYSYLDAQTDDARLVFRVIREGVRDGAVALNYARVEGLLRQRNGRVSGVAVRDLDPEGGGRTIEVQGTVVINATGAWADELRSQVGGHRRLRPLRGSHLVFPAEALPISCAISLMPPTIRRPIFFLPWEGVTLVGTTDVDHPELGRGEPSIGRSEVDFLLSATHYAFPDLHLAEADLRCTFAGIRAVLDTGKADPSKESREHVLWDDHGLLTITGGKLTTFRVMAHQALRAVRSQLPGQPFRRNRRVLDSVEAPTLLPDRPPRERLRLLGRYGADAPDLVTAAERGELARIHDSGNISTVWAELRWAARAEGVIHLDDLLLRRLRLGVVLPEGGRSWLARIRAIVQPELGWPDHRWQAEEAAYLRLWRAAYKWPSSSGQEPGAS